MKYKKGLIVICLIICVFSIASVCASDVNESFIVSENQNDDNIGIEHQEISSAADTNEIISSTENLNDVNLLYDDQIVEIDVLEDAVRTDKNFVYINTSVIASGWSHQDYFFDYNDNHVASKASDFYSLNLTLTPNTKYDYEFLGGTFVGGYDKYKPWVWNSGYQYSVMFKGNFTTDDNGYICNFTHNQNYKFVFKINGQIDFYGGDVSSYDLNNKYILSGKNGRLLKGSNLITLSVLSMKYNFNVFRPYTIFNGNTPVGSFSDLNDRLKSGLSEIVFDCDYVYNSKTDSSFQNGIEFDEYKELSIDGRGHVIDGSAQSKIFRISSNCILKNITFTNIFSSSYRTEGAIYWSGNSGTLENCRFTNISVNYGVGAIRSYCKNLIITNCYFDSNFAKDSLLYLDGGCAIIKNCKFINNSNVILVDPSVKSSEISNCLFINNNGSSIKNTGVEGMMVNCTFVNNYNNEGGALSVTGRGNVLLNSLFINNTASDVGGAIFWSGDEGIMNNCTFINNSASKCAGAISWTGEYGHVDNCLFINNTPNSNFSDTTTIFKKQLILNASNYEFDYNHLDPIHITINNMSDNLQISSPISFKLNNGIKTKNIIAYAVNNLVILFDEIANLDVGNWTVNAIFEGDDNYYPCNTTFMVAITPTDSYLAFDKINATYGKQTILTVNVFDYHNLKINEGTIELFDGEVQVGEAIVTNGVATLNYTPSAAGEHNIIAFYRANNYINSTNSTQLNVDKANPVITINLEDAIEGSDLIIDVDIAGATGKVTINGEEFSLVESKASKTIVNLVVGELPIDVVYFGDDNCLNSTKSTVITVKSKQNPDLDATVKDIEVGQTATIEIFINENITGKVTLNDKKIQITSGKCNYDIVGLSEGNYTYNVKFEGDKYFNEANKTVSFKVSKVAWADDKDPFIFKTSYGTQPNKLSYTLTLGSDATGTLTVTINKKTFTNELVNGIATVEVSGVPIGDYVVTIAYSGDSKYAPITRTANATVKIIPSIFKGDIKCKSYYGTDKTALTMKATIYNPNSNRYENGYVTFKVNGKSYKVKTKNGVATKTIKIKKAGTYTYTAKFTNNNYTSSVTGKAKLYVYSTSKKARTFNIKGYKFTLNVKQYYNLVKVKNTGMLSYKVKTNKKIKQTIEKVSYSYKWKYIKTVRLEYAHKKCYHNSNYKYNTIKKHWISDGEYYKTCKLYKKVEVKKVSYKKVNSRVYARIGYALNGQSGHDKYWIEVMTDNWDVVKGKLHWNVKASTLTGLKKAKPIDMKNFSMR